MYSACDYFVSDAHYVLLGLRQELMRTSSAARYVWRGVMLGGLLCLPVCFSERFDRDSLTFSPDGSILQVSIATSFIRVKLLEILVVHGWLP